MLPKASLTRKDFTGEQHDAYGKIVGPSWRAGATAAWAIIKDDGDSARNA